MRKRKHPRPNQRKRLQPSRRRQFFLRSGLVFGVMIALSLVLAGYTRKATAVVPRSTHAAQTTQTAHTTNTSVPSGSSSSSTQPAPAK